MLKALNKAAKKEPVAQYGCLAVDYCVILDHGCSFFDLGQCAVVDGR